MRRLELQALAKIRLDDARALISAGRYDGAYYLSGYAVECGLKACIAKLTMRYDFPDKARVLASYTHNLEQLVRAADLEAALRAEQVARPGFAVSWAVVKDWSEQSRYEQLGENRARDLYKAIRGRGGVMTWIRARW